jgi:hypothetical protein
MIPAAPACIANLATLLTYDYGIKFNNEKKYFDFSYNYFEIEKTIGCD